MITPGEVPVLELHDTLSPSEVKEVELHENIAREELPWPDRVSALAEIHAARLAENPSQTASQTAEELAAAGRPLSANKRHSAALLTEASVIAPHLSDPAIAKARNQTEALHLVYQKEEKAYAAALIKRTPKLEGQSSNCEVRKGDLLTELPLLESGFVDLVLADPPYGIGANAGGFRSRTIHHHNYEDSPEGAKIILQSIITEGFRIARPRANLFLFIDIDLFLWAKELAKRSGWDVFRTPITWQKSDSEGLAPWGRGGFRRCCEWLLFATKGERGLYHPPLDILRYNRVPRHEREYGPEKPIPLLEALIESSTLPGDMVLDPCCGSGSSLVAARRKGRKSLGIEISEAAYNLALVNSRKPLDQPPEVLAETEIELESL
jgi:DNA modification methylase